jgi:hypothetical protein
MAAAQDLHICAATWQFASPIYRSLFFYWIPAAALPRLGSRGKSARCAKILHLHLLQKSKILSELLLTSLKNSYRLSTGSVFRPAPGYNNHWKENSYRLNRPEPSK